MKLSPDLGAFYFTTDENVLELMGSIFLRVYALTEHFQSPCIATTVNHASRPNHVGFDGGMHMAFSVGGRDVKVGKAVGDRKGITTDLPTVQHHLAIITPHLCFFPRIFRNSL